MRLLTFIVILKPTHHIQAADKMQYLIGRDIWNAAREG
jgi:hypothetical protein